MFADKVHIILFNPVTGIIIALGLAAIAFSGRLSVNISNTLLFVAFSIGCFEIFRTPQSTHSRIIWCLLLGVVLTAISWWVKPSDEIKTDNFNQDAIAQKQITTKSHKKQAKASLATMPQIFITSIKATSLEVGKNIKIVVAYKTDKPVYNVSDYIKIVISYEGPLPNNYQLSPEKNLTKHPFVQANELNEILCSHEEILDINSVYAIQKEQTLVYVWGTIYYYDSNNRKYAFDLCYKYSPDDKAFLVCPFHNGFKPL